MRFKLLNNKEGEPLSDDNLAKIPTFLIEMLQNQYGENLTKEIIEGYTADRPVTFRVNTLKTDASTIEKILDKQGIIYEKVSYDKNAFIIKNERENAIKNLDIYKNGEIYLQSLSSMLPPIILNPQKGADILDMAAAPGGKTTQVAALSENKANITACEMNIVRAERLKYNIEKQGATCAYVMVTDARRIDDFFSFDQILLDAPCSGSGTLSIKGSDITQKFTQKFIDKLISSQKALLKKAITILKPGKEMIYSTCSILSCENEEIIDEVLPRNQAEIVPIEFKGIEQLPLLPSRIAGTICVCPTERYEGFFIAKIRKKW